MNVLLLEPFYSRFHIKVSRRLSAKLYVILFDLGFFVYVSGANYIVTASKAIEKSQPSQEDMEVAQSSISLYSQLKKKLGEEISSNEILYFAKYLAYLRKFLVDNSIGCVIMHNDLRWQHSLCIHLCRELSIKYIVTERGIFRPHTTTIDPVGVNAYSSLRDFSLDACSQVNSVGFEKRVIRQRDLFIHYMQFSCFLFLHQLGRVLKFNCPYANKDYSLGGYFKLLFLKFFESKKRNFQSISSLAAKKYFYVPLQVPGDTQIVVHSNFTTIQHFINSVEVSFYSSAAPARGYILVFKPHPLDHLADKYIFDHRSIISNASSSELLSSCASVITINSTVGFEGISIYKPVIVLGKAFYSLSGISFQATRDNLNIFINGVVDGTIITNKCLMRKFVKYCKYVYQLNVNMIAYKQSDLVLVVDRIRMYIDKKSVRK